MPHGGPSKENIGPTQGWAGGPPSAPGPRTRSDAGIQPESGPATAESLPTEEAQRDAEGLRTARTTRARQVDIGHIVMNGNALRIGSIAGIPIRIHVTFLIILPFLALAFGRVYREAARMAGIPAEQLGGSPFLWGLVVALALFLSVLVHELAHSLYALRKGGRVRDITLLMIGGVSQISEPPRGPRAEAVMALVGPITSLVLGGVFYLLYRAAAGTALFNLEFALFQLFYLNVVLGLFNLVPAFPMDGGRVLRGVLATRWGLLRATRVAASAGKVFAILFAILGFFSGNLLLMVIAFFVYVGAESETRNVLVKAVLGHVRVRDLVTSKPAPVDPSASIFEVGERMIRERRTGYPVARGEDVLGVVSLDDVQRVPPTERGRFSVAAVVRRVPPVDVNDEASKALRAFTEAGVGVIPVLDGGTLFGVLFQTDVMRGLQLGELEETQHPRDRGVLRRRLTEQHG
jgi:Zn-dependent protease/CBS domain-containing protein